MKIQAYQHNAKVAFTTFVAWGMWQITMMLVVLLVVKPVIAQETSFNSYSNAVHLPTLVHDANGNAVYSLHADDFIIEDDGVSQAVHLDGAVEAVPISLMIAVQCGRRAVREFDRIRTLRQMLDLFSAIPRMMPRCSCSTASWTSYATLPIMPLTLKLQWAICSLVTMAQRFSTL